MTDPYVVQCPACLAEAGEQCTNRIRQLESVHWSRHWLARQRRAHDRLRQDPAGQAKTDKVAAGARGGRGRSG